MKLAGGRLRNHPSRAGLTDESKAGPVWNGSIRFNAEWLDQPKRWRTPRKIFVCAHGDLFHVGVAERWIDAIFDAMADAPQHTYQILTKRPERAAQYMRDRGDRPRPPVIWWMTSAEDQIRANERIPHILRIPIGPNDKRGVSLEPLIGPIDLTHIELMAARHPECGQPPVSIDALRGRMGGFGRTPGRLDFVIVGGESGHDARPMHPDWIRFLRDQCTIAGAPFFFKQWGEWMPDPPAGFGGKDWRAVHRGGVTILTRSVAGIKFTEDGGPYAAMRKVGKAIAGALLDGREWRDLP